MGARASNSRHPSSARSSARPQVVAKSEPPPVTDSQHPPSPRCSAAPCMTRWRRLPQAKLWLSNRGCYACSIFARVAFMIVKVHLCIGISYRWPSCVGSFFSIQQSMLDLKNINASRWCDVLFKPVKISVLSIERFHQGVQYRISTYIFSIILWAPAQRRPYWLYRLRNI